MKHQFTPMRVIRLSSADAFSSLAAASGGDAAVARLDPPVYWNESDGTLRRQLLFRLQEVHDLVAHEEGGLLVAMEEAAAVGVAVDFTDCESAYDRAIRLLLHHPDLAHKALRFARADGLESSRYWVTRPGMPEGAVDFSKDALGELKHAVGGFYRSKEGRGDYQHIEHLVRTDAAHYFFVFLSDFPQRSDDFADDGHLTPRATRPGFEVVFAYHPDTRSLHTYARGGNKIIQPLQEIFASAILHGQPAPENPRRQPYHLNALLRRDTPFPTDPEDGVRQTRVRAVKAKVLGGVREGKRHIEFSVGLDAPPDDLHDMLDDYLNKHNLPLSRLHVTHAQIIVDFNERGPGTRLTIEIGPRSCNLKSKPEEQRLLGEKLLRRWKIETGS